jgi:hypothetical protein
MSRSDPPDGFAALEGGFAAREGDFARQFLPLRLQGMPRGICPPTSAISLSY